jgi:hypothetical protein
MMAGLAFALSLLVRETGLGFVAAASGVELLAGRRAAAATLSVVAIAPVLAWRLYVGWVQFPIYGVEAFLVNPHDLGIPFGGIVDMWHALRLHQYYPGNRAIATAAVVYPLLLTLGLVVSLLLVVKRPSPLAAVAVAYGLLAISLNFDQIWSGIGVAVRDTYELFIALAIATLSWRECSRTLKGGLVAFWIAAGAFVFYFSESGESIRQAMLN